VKNEEEKKLEKFETVLKYKNKARRFFLAVAAIAVFM
jgi:hypothetical protein